MRAPWKLDVYPVAVGFCQGVRIWITRVLFFISIQDKYKDIYDTQFESDYNYLSLKTKIIILEF